MDMVDSYWIRIFSHRNVTTHVWCAKHKIKYDVDFFEQVSNLFTYLKITLLELNTVKTIIKIAAL